MDTLAHRLPVIIRLPLVAALMIFVAAVASTQMAIFFLSHQAERQMETLGQVYLDGLSAALLPHVRDDDQAGILAVLKQALQFHEGVIDRRLVFLNPDQQVVADARRDDPSADLPPDLNPEGNGTSLSAVDGSLWIWRGLYDGPVRLGTVVAHLDISTFHEARGRLRWLLLLFDLAFSGLCAVLGFFMVRRLQRPVAVLARHLYDAALGSTRPIGPDEMPKGDRQTLRMFHAFNAMTHATHEREALLSHLADQERDAVLGRLAATIAHEVRNPLGGMRTAISTLKRYGDRPDTRHEAIGFLERGVHTLGEVVEATLESHRTRPQWRPLSRQDFEDLRLLVEADGRSRGVLIDVDLEVPQEIPVAALEVRQVLLNLLLNAVQASSKGGIVRLSAHIQEKRLLIQVKDEGGGLDPHLARAMEAGETVAATAGLGVAVVIRLVERLQGRVAVEARTGSGTTITLSFPLSEEGGIK